MEVVVVFARQRSRHRIQAVSFTRDAGSVSRSERRSHTGLGHHAEIVMATE